MSNNLDPSFFEKVGQEINEHLNKEFPLTPEQIELLSYTNADMRLFNFY